MKVAYNSEKLGDIFRDFFRVSGINVNLVDTDFSFLDCNPTIHNHYCQCIQDTKPGQKECFLSDLRLLKECRNLKKPVHHICHGGLLDIAVPIIYEDEILGYLILGQIKHQEDFTPDREHLIGLGCDVSQMEDRYRNLPLTPTENIESTISIVTMLAEYVLVKNMLSLSTNPGLKRAVDYIHRHLTENLDIISISQHANLSKSALYQNFHKHFHCTVNDYINQKRMERAKMLLSHTDFSMEEIAHQVGFSGVSYFGRIFKKLTECTPRQYRNREK